MKKKIAYRGYKISYETYMTPGDFACGILPGLSCLYTVIKDSEVFETGCNLVELIDNIDYTEDK